MAIADADVVAEIERWLDWGFVPGEDNPTAAEVLTRARDEIVALRDQLARVPAAAHVLVRDSIAGVRAEALEEAAQVCFRANPQSNPNAMGHAIRALKDTP